MAMSGNGAPTPGMKIMMMPLRMAASGPVMKGVIIRYCEVGLGIVCQGFVAQPNGTGINRMWAVVGLGFGWCALCREFLLGVETAPARTMSGWYAD